MEKKIVYFDMDNTLADFQKAKASVPEEIVKALPWDERWNEPAYDKIPGYFAGLEPVPGAVEAVRRLHKSGRFDMYILSKVPWSTPAAAVEKIEWVQRYFGQGKECVFYKRIIFSPCKNLSKGDYLIDDYEGNGTAEFEGEWIQFGSERFPDWETVVEYLLSSAE